MRFVWAIALMLVSCGSGSSFQVSNPDIVVVGKVSGGLSAAEAKAAVLAVLELQK